MSTYGPGHRGLDLAAAPGAPVLAVEGGLVTHAGSVAGRGTVTVEHGDGLRSTYEPVTPGVARGARVEAGDALGVVQRVGSPDAAPHCATATCLHLGARLGPAYVDPLPLLTGGRLALLPLTIGR
ncbi:MAG TPA: M23 family metallopeptidase [Ornithinibacter sp.]|nr:M23 family metallopeptidase [Ornithinibacter sp.]